MSDRSVNPNEGLLAFLDGIKSWIGGSIALISALVGFVQLVRSNTALTVLVLLAGVVVGMWLCAVYIFVKQEPLEPKGRRARTGRRSSAPQTSAAPPHTMTKAPRRHAYSDRVRHLALGASSLVSLLTVAGLVGWSRMSWGNVPVVPRPTVPLVVVATFANYADAQAHHVDTDAVTQFIYSHLDTAATRDAASVQVSKLDQSVENAAVARVQGTAHGATIVLWGWYAKSSKKVILTLNFDVLIPVRDLQLRESTESVNAAVEELQSFSIQNQLATSMSYLTFLTLGLARYEAGAYQSAIALFDDAQRETPPTGMVGADSLYFYRGNAHFFRREYRMALADFDRAIARGSAHAASYYNRGVVRRILGDWKGALDDYGQAIQLDQTDAYALYNRGLLLAGLGRVAAAIADYSRAIHYAPRYANAYLSRGNARLRLGDESGATADYSRVIQLDLHSVAAYSGRAGAYYMVRDWGHALADYNRAIGLEPRRASLYYGRGNVYVARVEYKNAISDYSRAIRMAPREPYLYYSRGNAYEDAKDWAHAAADYSTVIRLSPRGPYAIDAYLDRADVRAALGDARGAQADRRTARALQREQRTR